MKTLIDLEQTIECIMLWRIYNQTEYKMAERKFWMKTIAWQIVLVIILREVVKGCLTGRDSENGSVVLGCSHDSGGLCYVAILASLSDEVTNHGLIEKQGHPVWSNTNATYIEVVFMPTDDERDKYIIEVYENKTKKEGSCYYISLKELKKGFTMKPTSPYTSKGPTPIPDTTTGQIPLPNTSTGPTLGPDSSIGPTPYSTVDDMVPIIASIAATMVFLAIVAVVIIGIVLAIKRSSSRKEKTGDVPSDTV